MTRSDGALPVVDPDGLGERHREGVVVGVLLAAGTSTRFGDRNKLLVAVDGEPLVRHAARSLLASAADPVIVVTGYGADEVRGVLEGLDVEFTHNPDFASGQASSVAVGVAAALGHGADAAVFALGDMPGVEPSSITALIEAYRAGEGDAVAAAYRGERGNPVLFDSRFFDALADGEGDTGGRDLLLAHGVLVETGDPGVVLDIDTPADLDRSS